MLELQQIAIFGLLEHPDKQNIKMIQLALEVRDDRYGGPEEE